MSESIFLAEIAKLPLDGKVTLGEIAEQLKSKGLVFLALLAVLPFVQPIPIPGLSTLLGLVILLQGVALLSLRQPLLTRKMRATALPPDKVIAFVHGARKVFPLIGWLVRPRGARWVHHRGTHAVAGLALIFLSAILSLPLPIPSSNFLPAIGIFFICLGLLEDDLLLVCLGVAYALLFAWLLTVAGHVVIAEFQQVEWWPF